MQFIETWISMWYDFTGKANYKMERKKETDMYNIRKVTDDITWIGASDRRLALFENIFPIKRGVSYNSYVLLDEQTVLFDTVDASVAGQFSKPGSCFRGKNIRLPDRKSYGTGSLRDDR